jgi:hypothetical protein
VFYEAGAEVHAKRVAQVLPQAITRVEECHTAPFESRFRVYVCASHDSFTRRIGHPATIPVRGIAFHWDVWISPKSFAFYGRDTHQETLTHELSHLHLGQHLGWWRRAALPTWFSEGLADWVADTGTEIVSREEALQGLRTGHHLVPDAPRRLPIPRTPQDYGVTWPMLHSQSRLFIEYLHSGDGESFREFVAAVVRGSGFAVAFTDHFDRSLDEAWREFLKSVQTDSPAGH